jgi:hypothetical protein
MKRFFAILLVMAFAASSTQHLSAQISVNVRYGLRDYLDLQAVATAFSQSRNISEFEHQLNDYRNRISNLDLNNDGYIDYLRVEQYSDYDEHVIQIQSVLGRNYYQPVATIYIGYNRYNEEYIQIVGDESIYGRNYILEPVFRRRPVIVHWLWDFRSPRYVSPYYWGYYPRHYRVRHIVALPSYHNHMKRYVDHRHHYIRPEYSSRPVKRDNRGQVLRGDENRNYNEGNRKPNQTQRPSVDSRQERTPEVIQRDNRQPDVRQNSDNRQPDVRQNSDNRQPDVRQRNDNSKQDVKQSEERRPEVKKTDEKKVREQVRDSRPEPAKSTPAPPRSTESSRQSKSENSSGRR